MNQLLNALPRKDESQPLPRSLLLQLANEVSIKKHEGSLITNAAKTIMLQNLIVNNVITREYFFRTMSFQGFWKAQIICLDFLVSRFNA